MKYFINEIACSMGFECCGQPCLAAGDGIIKEEAGVCCFTQTPIDTDTAAERARKVCPAGAIRCCEETPLDLDDEGDEFF